MSFNVDYIINLGVNTSMSSLGGTFATVLSTGLIVAWISKSIKAFDRQEQALAQVRTGLESTGNTAGKTLEGLQKTAQNFQKTTIFGDEDILTGVTSQLLTFTNIAGEQFDRTQKAALDVTSRLFGVDASAESLRSTSIQLGKALNDPTSNMGALSRSGIQFSDQQKEVIKNLQKTGNLAGAQTIILDELQKQYGGSAEAAAKAGAGGLKQFQNQMGDIVEEIGGVLLPIISKMANTFLKFIDFVKRNATAFKIIGGAILGLVAVVVTIIAAIKAWSAVQLVINFLLTANPIGIIIVAIGALIGAIIAAWHTSETFRGVLFALWEVIEGLGLAVWNMLIKPFSALKEIWDGLEDLFSGKGFDKLLSGVKNLGKAIINFLLQPFFSLTEIIDAIFGTETTKKLEKFTGATSIFGNIKEDAEQGFKDGVDDFNKEDKKEGGLDSVFGSPAGGLAGAAAGGVGKGLGSGIDKVTSSAPKTFNINIDSLVRDFKISTTNMQESATKTKEMITQALITAVNDVSIIDK